MSTRKKIVLNFINKIILYKNKIIITYNFTDIMPKETTNLTKEEIEKQSQEGIAFYDFISSNKEPNSAPKIVPLGLFYSPESGILSALHTIAFSNYSNLYSSIF